MAEMSLADNFNTVFAAIPLSPTLRGIWREVYSGDYPEEAEPFSYVTRTDLHRIASELRVRETQTFADLACGRGGPGLWVAHWEFESTPPGWPPQVNGHHQLLHEAGFEVEVSEETPDWQPRQNAVYDGIRKAQAALLRKLGEIAATDLLTEAQEFPALLKQSRRVLIVARRRSPSSTRIMDE